MFNSKWTISLLVFIKDLYFSIFGLYELLQIQMYLNSAKYINRIYTEQLITYT